MDAAPSYDTTRLAGLREELKRLNEAAIESGLLAVRDGVTLALVRPRRRELADAQPPEDGAPRRKARGKAAASAPKAKRKISAAAAKEKANMGKAGAARLLMMGARGKADTSADVPGTNFTEAGVVRLVAHLGKRHERGFRFLRRLHRFLTRPVNMGARTSAGISVERLQILSRQLKRIEAIGWHDFQLVQASRQGRRVATATDVVAAKPRKRKAKAASKTAAEGAKKSTRAAKAEASPAKAKASPAKAKTETKALTAKASTTKAKATARSRASGVVGKTTASRASRPRTTSDKKTSNKTRR